MMINEFVTALLEIVIACLGIVLATILIAGIVLAFKNRKCNRCMYKQGGKTVPIVKLYRKKPVVIQAYQTGVEMDIETLEGIMHANVGDYIVTGVKGEQYPCKPDIFEETYEEVNSNGK